MPPARSYPAKRSVVIRLLRRLAAWFARAAFAAAATSVFPSCLSCPEYGSVFLINATDKPMTVRIASYDGRMECEKMEADPLGTLKSVEWTKPYDLELQRYDPTDIDGGADYHSVCHARLVTGEGFSPTALLWWGHGLEDVCQGGVHTQLRSPNAVAIERVGDTVLITASAIQVWPLE